MLQRLLAIIALPLLLGACSSARVQMNTEQRNTLKELQLQAVVPQEEVKIAVKPSGAAIGGAAFGVVGVLIGASIDAAAVNAQVTESQKLVGNFYLAADDIDFRAMLDARLRASLKEYPFPIKSIVMSPVFPTLDSIQRATASLEPHQGILVLFSGYELSADYRQLTTSTIATIWKKGSTEPLHRSILIYQSEPLGEGQMESISKWSANGATEFRRAIEAATEKIAQLVEIDIRLVEDRKKSNPTKATFNTAFGQTDISGELLQQDTSRVILLTDAGVIYDLPSTLASVKAQ